MRELEGYQEAFVDALAAIVQRAKQHEPRVGAHVHVDGTEDETHAALIHDCGPDDACPYRQRRGAGSAHRPLRVATQVARRDRQTRNAADEGDEPEPEQTEIVERGGRLIKRIRLRDCWYRTNDLEAGIRAYMSPRGARRFWTGYYNQKFADHFTGGVLLPGVHNASTQEYDAFPDLYAQLCRVLGEPPQTMIADKGQSISRVFELLARNGTAAVMPWRTAGGDRIRHDHDTHDRHGVPRCRHCGGPTEFRRFSAANDRPRIWFSCLLGATPECAREQTIRCDEDWRLLIPLWRTDPLYHELEASLGCFEGVHDWWRDRYKVGADTLACRPKAVGIGLHQLRALAAGVVEWLRICFRQGWLGSARRDRRHPRRPRLEVGIARARSLSQSRARNGLLCPYGPRAAELALGEVVPPSRRPRGHPVAV